MKRMAHTYEKEGDMLRCTECGFCMASKENQIHGAYHKLFIDARAKYGKTNVLTYVQYRDAEAILKDMKLNKKLIMDASNPMIQVIYRVRYTYSLRAWDYSKVHPELEEFIYLLWNTPQFINWVASYVAPKVIVQLRNKYRANRKIGGREMICHSVENTSNGGYDLSHLDVLINAAEDIEDEELKIDEGVNDEKETEDLKQALFAALAKIS